METKSIAEVCEIISGGTPKTSVEEYWNGNIGWLSVKDFSGGKKYVYDSEKTITELGVEKSSTNILREKDIILSARGTVGEMAMIGTPMAFNQSCFGLRTKNSSFLDQEYLFYALKNSINAVTSVTQGSVFETINRASFERIYVKYPDIITQRKIAKFLSSIDSKIEVNSQINRNLSEQAKAIFEKELLKFDSVPEGWKEGSLIDIADYLNGLAMQKFRPSDDEDGLPVLKIKELRQGSCDSSSELCSPNVKPEYIIHDGDVIFSWSGSLLVDFWCGGECGLNQHLFKVTSKNYDKWFYYAWTLYHLDRFIAVAADKATTMGHIKRDELSKAEVLIPETDSYKKIGEALEPIYDLIISNRVENRKLATLRDELLPKLMSGEIDVSEVDYE